MAIYTNIFVGDSAQVEGSIDVVKGLLTSTYGDSFSTYFQGCFTLQPTLDCDTLVFEEFPDYVGVSNLIIDITLIYKTDCGDVIISPTQDYISGSGPIHFTDLDSDGVYCMQVHISFQAGGGKVAVIQYDEILTYAYDKDCCKRLYDALSETMLSKMSSDSCTMVKYSKVGRNVLKLKKSYTKISNLMWAYNNSSDACSERDKAFCLFNKIK